MIPSDREIRALVRRGVILLDPLPMDPGRWSATTVDLALDAEINVWERPDGPGVIDPSAPGFKAIEVCRSLTRVESCAVGFLLEPQRFVLGWTIEKLKLPHESRIAARVEGKSSLARIGLGIHVTAPTIHPGFGSAAERGLPICLEIWNVGVYAIRLTRGLPICQLIFEEVHGTPDEGYEGQFSRQGPESPS